MPLIDISVLTACRLFITWAWVFCGSVEEHLDFNQIYTGWRNTILHLEITNAIEVRITVRYDNHTMSKGVIIRLEDKWQTLGEGWTLTIIKAPRAKVPRCFISAKEPQALDPSLK